MIHGHATAAGRNGATMRIYNLRPYALLLLTAAGRGTPVRLDSQLVARDDCERCVKTTGGLLNKVWTGCEWTCIELMGVRKNTHAVVCSEVLYYVRPEE